MSKSASSHRVAIAQSFRRGGRVVVVEANSGGMGVRNYDLRPGVCPSAL